MATVSHYRDRDRAEVDLVIEAAGRIAAVEIKAGSAADATAIRNLILLRDRLGEQFTAGVVLHTGHDATVLGDRIHGLPLAALWEL